MRLVEPNNTIKAVMTISKIAVLVAVISQIMTPFAALADFGHEMANSTQKIAAFDTVSLVNTMSGGSVLPKLVNLEEEKPDRVIDAVITAYTSTPDQTDDDPFIAASGKRVHDGMIAANGLPFGTRIKIPALYGDKIFIVEDRMNSRYGFGRMDIWMDSSKSEARKFGVKRVEVEIYYKKTQKEVAVNKK